MSEELEVQNAIPPAEVTEQTEANSPVEEENNEVEAPAEAAEKQDPWYKRRIDELTRDKHEARRQVERMEKLMQQQEEMLRRIQPEDKPQESKLTPPDPRQFAGGEYDPRYMEAVRQYDRESIREEMRQTMNAEYEARQQREAMSAQQAKLETAEAAARAKYPDYDSVIETITSDPRLSQNPTIRQALLGLDNGPDIAYQLGRDPALAYEIASMNPIQAGMKLASLIRPEATPRSAPKPISPITGTGNNSGKPDPANMSTKDYIAYMNNKEREERAARRTR